MQDSSVFWDFAETYQGQTHLYRMYHENSKHSPHVQSVRAPKSDYMDRLRGVEAPPVPINSIYKMPKIGDLRPYDTTLAQALKTRRTSWDFDRPPLTDPELLDFMGYAFGEADSEKGLRTYPSGGRFYPVDIYLLPTEKLQQASGLMSEARCYRLGEMNTQLEGLHPIDLGALNTLTSASDLAMSPFDKAQFLVVLVGNTRFIERKYGSLSYRLIYQELGHIGQNIQLVCEMMALKSVPLGGFFEDRINAYLNLEVPHQTAMYVFVVG